MSTREWPAPAHSLAAARELLVERVRARAGPIAIAADSDVDGLSACALFVRAIERLGGGARPLVARRGEHVHTDTMRDRIRVLAPALLVVVDMGSRSGAIVPGVPTLLVDHHRPAGFPDGAVVVSAYAHEPVAPTGLLAFTLLRVLADVDDLAWLAVMSAFADLGSVKDFPELAPVMRACKRTHVARAVSLLNAARRASRFRGDDALAVLLSAREPADIALHRVPGVDVLEECKDEVTSELDRVSRIAPRIVGNVALIRFSSSAQVHPLVATRWRTRLRGKVVLAANDGYVDGRVSFAMRTSDPNVDLIALLEKLTITDEVRARQGDIAFGHPQATGGRVTPHEFDRVLEELGFVTRVAPTLQP